LAVNVARSSEDFQFQQHDLRVTTYDRLLDHVPKTACVLYSGEKIRYNLSKNIFLIVGHFAYV